MNIPKQVSKQIPALRNFYVLRIYQRFYIHQTAAIALIVFKALNKKAADTKAADYFKHWKLRNNAKKASYQVDKLRDYLIGRYHVGWVFID